MSCNPDASDFATNADIFWLLFGTILVFFMQAGFALLEAGCVRAKNTKNILVKNVMDACLGALIWYIIGYPLAYGTSAGGFIGSSWDVMGGCASYADWLFQWAFAAAAATIVSGAVAERCTLNAYFIYTCVITAFIYPVVIHWGWTSDGWLASNGFKDFAGSALVHMVGGSSALMGAIAMGPRHGRFTADGVVDLPGHSSVLAALGTLILWFGWYGFNGVSTLSFFAMGTAARVMMTTTLAASTGGAAVMLINVLHKNPPDIGPPLNGILAGLVSITAPCAVVEPYMAIVIAIIGACVYYYSSMLLKKLRIDDPLDAAPVHCFCGAWGAISVGLFATKDFVEEVYGPSNYGAFYGDNGTQLGWQLAGVCAILAWTCSLTGLVFFGMKFMGILRVPVEEEIQGLDTSHHGGAAYHHFPEGADVAYAGHGTSKNQVKPSP
mmetsp:Transcript_10538/g.30001  ORF Transcript_10538/g.30001 Transcript_10538/m.30001 type:complete len:438 (-) Transcript_10538:212-1525(-)|eukprot:CAMPEP_0117680118 /NCGR_PEP_ID=MMETSP0804-20121206/18169_1 /TAXON_ID=1074897 /ORGANISM="Tetraselmis astigmatica, Strain CCMP880" /LENGTH=437 /DNA_ID=CAMNT_0005489569 /DNA_START=104 /DNA_END=1417 /DNA_ORIENTATION=+